MKVNYKGLATSVALAFTVLIGATDITSAQGRRGRGQERSEETQEQKDQRKAQQEASRNSQRQEREQQRQTEQQQGAQERAEQQRQREAQRATQQAEQNQRWQQNRQRVQQNQQEQQQRWEQNRQRVQQNQQEQQQRWEQNRRRVQQNQEQQRGEQQQRWERERQQQQIEQNQDWQRRQREQQDAARRQQSGRIYSDRANNLRGDWRVYQQQRANQYWQEWSRQQSYALQRQRLLEQQRRRAQLAYQRAYLERLRRDQLRLQSWRYSDYGPYNYRYYRGGSYYETNRYGAQMLRQAINYGYEEGFRAGQADREDGWDFSPQEAFGYQDASYGYDGYYVDLNEYQYYFREGFNRGYEDGYYSRYQYGRYSNGTLGILGTILEQILNLQLIN